MLGHMRYDQSYRKTLLLGAGMVGQETKKGQHERIPLIKAQYIVICSRAQNYRLLALLKFENFNGYISYLKVQYCFGICLLKLRPS
jgi:hypothetical protein